MLLIHPNSIVRVKHSPLVDRSLGSLLLQSFIPLSSTIADAVVVAADRSNAVVAAAVVKRIDPECC